MAQMPWIHLQRPVLCQEDKVNTSQTNYSTEQGKNISLREHKLKMPLNKYKLKT